MQNQHIIHIRPMSIDDYEEVANLWAHIEGFYIRSVDDSREGIERFLKRNPNLSVVAEMTNQKNKQECDLVLRGLALQSKESKPKIVGSILCGHDGRYGSIYHACVHKDFRLQGIGKSMVAYALEGFKRECITSIALIAFSENLIGNAFWKTQGWDLRTNTNRYELSLNTQNTLTKI